MIEFVGLEQGLITGAVQGQTFVVMGLDTEDIEVVMSNPSSIEALRYLGQHFTSLVTRGFGTRTDISSNVSGESTVFRHAGICTTNNTRIFPSRVLFGPNVAINSTYIAPWLLSKLAFGLAQGVNAHGITLTAPDAFLQFDIVPCKVASISYSAISLGQTLYVDTINEDDSVTTVNLGALPGVTTDRVLNIGRVIKGVRFRATGTSHVYQVKISADAYSLTYEKPYKRVESALMYNAATSLHGVPTSKFDPQEMIHLLASECGRSPRYASPLGHGIPRFLGIKASYES